MRKVCYLNDWPLCLAAGLLGLLMVALAQNIWRNGGSLDALPPWQFVSCTTLPLVSLLLWRITIIHRVNRHSITVRGVVIKTDRNPKGGDVAHVEYAYGAYHVRTRFTWVGPGALPEVETPLSLLIDPAKPERCYVVRVGHPAEV